MLHIPQSMQTLCGTEKKNVFKNVAKLLKNIER